MFENLRWRITLMFVGLSALIYVSLTALGLVIFEHRLTASLDEELRVAISEIGHAIVIESGVPKFRDWIRTVQTEPPRSLATIQLYDSSFQLLERYGPLGVERLSRGASEIRSATKSVRVLVSPVTQRGVIRGYVQVQLSTRERDQAMQELRWDACLIGVLFLVALSAASHWIARRVTRPIQDSVQILRSFVADASHELNTPLTILQARIEALERKLSRLGIQQEDLAVATKSLERLNQVVSDLLLLSEVEDPIADIRKTRISVSNILSQTAGEMKDRFDAKGIKLTIHADPDAVVEGNMDALQRLFSNLLENALRYTDEPGQVTVAVVACDKNVRIDVQDTGIGMPAESLPRIFDRFFRVDKSRSRDSGGTGLGLSIAKAITDAHHGFISVESTLGEGSTFSVVLPRLKSRQASSAAP